MLKTVYTFTYFGFLLLILASCSGNDPENNKITKNEEVITTESIKQELKTMIQTDEELKTIDNSNDQLSTIDQLSMDKKIPTIKKLDSKSQISNSDILNTDINKTNINESGSIITNDLIKIEPTQEEILIDQTTDTDIDQLIDILFQSNN